MHYVNYDDEGGPSNCDIKIISWYQCRQSSHGDPLSVSIESNTTIFSMRWEPTLQSSSLQGPVCINDRHLLPRAYSGAHCWLGRPEIQGLWNKTPASTGTQTHNQCRTDAWSLGAAAQPPRPVGGLGEEIYHISLRLIGY